MNELYSVIIMKKGKVNMDINYRNAPKTTVGDIPNGECFSYNGEIYIKVANDLNVDTYNELMSATSDNYDFIAVRLSDGMVDAFSYTCQCDSVTTELNVYARGKTI